MSKRDNQKMVVPVAVRPETALNGVRDFIHQSAISIHDTYPRFCSLFCGIPFSFLYLTLI